MAISILRTATPAKSVRPTRLILLRSVKVYKSGRLKLKYKLDKADKKVRVLIFFDDDDFEDEEEKLWMYSISKNPTFDILQDPEEDILFQE